MIEQRRMEKQKSRIRCASSEKIACDCRQGGDRERRPPDRVSKIFNHHRTSENRNPSTGSDPIPSPPASVPPSLRLQKHSELAEAESNEKQRRKPSRMSQSATASPATLQKPKPQSQRPSEEARRWTLPKSAETSKPSTETIRT